MFFEIKFYGTLMDSMRLVIDRAISESQHLQEEPVYQRLQDLSGFLKEFEVRTEPLLTEFDNMREQLNMMNHTAPRTRDENLLFFRAMNDSSASPELVCQVGLQIGYSADYMRRVIHTLYELSEDDIQKAVAAVFRADE